MQLCFQNRNKQPCTSSRRGCTRKCTCIKPAGLEISFQTALKSVRQAEVLPETGGSLHFHETLNSATDHLNRGTFSKISLPTRSKGHTQHQGLETRSVRSPGAPVHTRTHRCPPCTVATGAKPSPVPETWTRPTLGTQHPRPGRGCRARRTVRPRRAFLAGGHLPRTQPVPRGKTTGLHSRAESRRASAGRRRGSARARPGHERKETRVWARKHPTRRRGAAAAATPAAATAEAKAMSGGHGRGRAPQWPPAPR